MTRVPRRAGTPGDLWRADCCSLNENVSNVEIWSAAACAAADWSRGVRHAVVEINNPIHYSRAANGCGVTVAGVGRGRVRPEREIAQKSTFVTREGAAAEFVP